MSVSHPPSTARSEDAVRLKERLRHELRWLRLRLAGHAALMLLGSAGLLLAAGVTYALLPEPFPLRSEFGIGKLVLAGLIVGFGTSLGSGCTSGHGVCGLSRLSGRSLVATMTFMVVGVATAVALRQGGLW